MSPPSPAVGVSVSDFKASNNASDAAPPSFGAIIPDRTPGLHPCEAGSRSKSTKVWALRSDGRVDLENGVGIGRELW